MDATANEIDVEGVNVKGFPTIIFFKGNDKKNPVKYVLDLCIPLYLYCCFYYYIPCRVVHQKALIFFYYALQ